MRVFFDTSAFVKRYIAESGTDAALDWCHRPTEIGLSAIAMPELISAFCRLQRENKISIEQCRQLKMALLSDVEDIATGDLTPRVLLHTMNSLEKMSYGQWKQSISAVQWPWNAISLSMPTNASLMRRNGQG
jgi:uncharacterized protein